MDDDTVTNPESEADEPEDQEVTDDPNPEVNDEGEGDDSEGDEQEAEPELEDVEYEGKVHKLPKELKDALLRQSDYTRKTQEVAEQKRAFEESQKTFQEQVQFQQQFLRDNAQIIALDDQIEQYAKIDFDLLNTQDPVKAQALWFQFQKLKDRRATAVQAVQQKAQTLAEQRKSEYAKQIEEGQAVLRKEIPNYGPELVSKLRDFGVTQCGLRAEEIDRVTDPRHVKLLNLAYIGHQLAEKQRKAMTKKPPAEANPVPTVKSKGKPDNRLRDDISTDEWMKRRNAQLAARSR